MAALLGILRETQMPRVSQYTRDLLARAEGLHSKESRQYRGIYNQYFRMPTAEAGAATSERHFNALGDLPAGVERLYRRVAIVSLLTACSSECVFCIRGLYSPHTLSQVEIEEAVNYLSQDEYLTEVLITGGDPLVSPKKLHDLISAIATSAPNIQAIRIGTRLPVQNPFAIGEDTYNIFQRYSKRFLFEIPIQVNHPFELQPEAVSVIQRLIDSGVRLYSQNVLLKKVNDDLETLIELYDRLRSLRLIPYYFYHAVPMVGTDEFRTSVERGLELARQLTTCGFLSGLGKPMFTIMSAVGKVTLYEGSILSRSNGVLTLRTSYRLEDRLTWNPGYRLPPEATVNELGTLDVQYVDGTD